MEVVPFVQQPGVRFGGQARLHPRRYLAGLAEAISLLGGRIYEDSDVREFHDDPRVVGANGAVVSCGDVVIATHTPLAGLGGSAGTALLQTRLAAYTTYAVAGHVAPGTVPDALWWDTADPYHYLRIDRRRDADVVILGGEDHKTGQQADPEACHRRLEQQLIGLCPDVQIAHRWSGQVIETPDGLPYIGRTAEHEYTATGYGGNGLTFGTLAGMMIADIIAGRGHTWAGLFEIDRAVPAAGVWSYVKENADYPYYLVRDRLSGAAESVRDLAVGDGRVIERSGTKVAAFRDDAGRIVLRSAVCTHLGCVVRWNAAARTWDCPCHGSRFTPDGDVLAGPAVTPLPPVD